MRDARLAQGMSGRLVCARPGLARGRTRRRPGIGANCPLGCRVSPGQSRAQEADAIWYWIGQVGPEEGVLAAYEVTAPLSSRKRLFSYVLEQNKPRGFPRLGPEFQWIFLRNKALDFRVFSTRASTSFIREHFLTVLHRATPSSKEP